MSTPAKKMRIFAKQLTATPEEKTTLSGKRARKQEKKAAMRVEDNRSAGKAVLSAAEATPSKPDATISTLENTARKKPRKKGKREYGNGESSETGMPPNRKHVGEKPKTSRPQKPVGENVAKSKKSGVHDSKLESEDDWSMTLSFPESSAPAEINESLDKNENEEKRNKKKPVKRKKKVSKEKATLEIKRPKNEETGMDYCLYLGNLNSAKDSEEIKKAIITFFTQKSLTVCSVRLGGTKKYGYANFSTAADLEKALEMDGGEILGLECNMKARNTEGLAEITREREARTLFVKNLPYSTTPADLQDVFTDAVNLRLSVRKDGSARGMAYVEFESETEADKAFKEKQGADVKGRPVILDYTGEKSRKRLVDIKTLVVSNISKKATESSLKEVFQKAIAIRIKQHNNPKQKGVALVEFSTVEDAKEALESRSEVVIEGLKVHLMLQGAQPAQTKTLFVRGLSRETTENSLREAFDGAVDCRISTDQKTGECRGFGFVEFSTCEDACAAKKAMEGFEIGGNMVTLEFAKPKAEGSRAFDGRSKDSKGGGRGGKGHGGGGKGRGGKKVVKGGDGKSSVGVEGGTTGNGTCGKKAEKGNKEIGRRGGKVGFGKMASSRGGEDGKSGFGGTGGRKEGSERGKGGFGSRGDRANKGRFGGGRGGLGSRRGGSTRAET